MMKTKILFLTYFAVLFASLAALPLQAEELLCVKKQVKLGPNATIRLARAIKAVSGSACPKGYVQLTSTASFKGETGATGPQGTTGATGEKGDTGAQGQQGPAGSDANLEVLVYGDGSAGELIVNDSTGDVSLSDTQNLNFTNIRIESGRKVSAAQGRVIRCTGTFENHGILDSVYTGSGKPFHTVDTGTVDALGAAWLPNFRSGSAGAGELARLGFIATGGSGANGMIAASLTTAFVPPPAACGVGAPGSGNISYCGQTLKVFCKGQITNTNTGTIDATAPNASSGAGGGSGGFIVLASQTGVTNDGLISANGGNGGASTASFGAGGGGGGGVVHLVAPIIDGSGIVQVDFGSAGSNAVDATNDPRRGGGGGGGLGGGGGNGGGVNADNTVQAASNGTAGDSLATLEDPTSFILQELTR